MLDHLMQLPAPYAYSRRYIIHRLETNQFLPAHLHLDTHYIVKPQLHCSLVAIKKLAPQLEQRDHLTPDQAEQRALEVATAAIIKFRPSFQGYLDDIRIAANPAEQKQTIIIMAQVSHLDEVFQFINQTLHLTQPPQPPHVTLYTLSNELSIGLTSPEELATRTRPLTQTEHQKLAQQIKLEKMIGIAA
jgi:hypothetical protein